MPEQDDYVTINVRETARRQARIAKAKREQTWTEFLSDAANALGADSND